jgi:hypothetical protein
MSDAFEDIGNRMPDMASVLAQRISARKAEEAGTTLPAPGTFDPYQAMIKKKQGETSPVDPGTIQKWPEEDTKKLEDYCQKMGVVGFNSGRMHPIAALAMLKQRFGDDFSNVPLEERVPAGYEKMGTKSSYGPNYPYGEAIKKKQIIHG